MARSSSIGVNSPRRQRRTAAQIHERHYRRPDDYHPLPLRPVTPRPLQRSTGSPSRMHHRQPQLRYRDRDYALERHRPDGRLREYGSSTHREDEHLNYSNQIMSFDHHHMGNFRTHRDFIQQRGPGQSQALFQPTSEFEQTRRREDERRLAAGPRGLAVLRGGNIPRATSGIISHFEQLQRAAIHEQNRTQELTRLNSVMVQRNNTIAEGQYKIAEQDIELGKMREALKNMTFMAVALHGICSRQQDFMKNITTSISPPDEGQGQAQKMQFEAWVRSNELYMAHVQEKISFEKNWENIVPQANAQAFADIGRAAELAAQRVAQSTPKPNGQPVAQETFQHALQELIDDAVNRSGAELLDEDVTG